MAKKCFLCGKETLFFKWSTDRYFPREKLLGENPPKSLRVLICNVGVPVCFSCLRKLENEEK